MTSKRLWDQAGLRYKSHPWHGIELHSDSPNSLMAFVEVTPHDSVKYEIDKLSGYLKVDRPQKFSNIVPALYGFLPQTYCMEEVAERCKTITGNSEIVGDGDPLDVLILSERNITHGNILVPCIPIGGLRMIDGGEADDKIIAVLKGDEVYKDWNDISDLPENMIERLHHYFLTYKNMPGQKAKCEIVEIYGKDEANQVIQASEKDYKKHFGNINDRLDAAVRKDFIG